MAICEILLTQYERWRNFGKTIQNEIDVTNKFSDPGKLRFPQEIHLINIPQFEQLQCNFPKIDTSKI